MPTFSAVGTHVIVVTCPGTIITPTPLLKYYVYNITANAGVAVARVPKVALGKTALAEHIKH